MDGCDVATMDEAARTGDIFVTTTGCRDVIAQRHYEVMKDGAILANAGHFNVEIDVEGLADMSEEVNEARANVAEYRLPGGRRVYLLGEGRLVNLACADGHPAEIMDLSFGLQVLALKYLVDNPALAPGVHPVSRDIDREVSAIRLRALGISIDQLTEDQRGYLQSWQM